jgi:hypothetical protein
VGLAGSHGPLELPFSVAFLARPVAAGSDAGPAVPRTGGGEPLRATCSGRCAGPLERLLEAKRLSTASPQDGPWGLAVRELGAAGIVPFGREAALLVNAGIPTDHRHR